MASEAYPYAPRRAMWSVCAARPRGAAACGPNVSAHGGSISCAQRSRQDLKMARRGRLYARPTLVDGPAPLGLQPLIAAGLRDSYIYVPTGYDFRRPGPAITLL